MRGTYGAGLTRVHNLETSAIERWDGAQWVQDLPLPGLTQSQVPTITDGIAVVADAAARAARFPSPASNQRAQRLDTGYIERWTGTTWVPESKTRAAGPEISLKALGAIADGVTDCAPAATTAVTGAIALAAAERAAGRDSIIDFDPGVYFFNSSADFTGCTMRFAPGAVIKRAAAATITLGRIVAADYKILDNSAGGAGQFLPSATTNDSIPGRWCGVKADGTDDSPGMNLLADLCWGKAGAGTRYGFNNATKNRVPLLPGGVISLQSASWNISGTVGAKIVGMGRLATSISVDTANMVGVIADAVAYLHLDDIIVTTTQPQDTSHPLIDCDFTGTYPSNQGYLRPQQWTVSRMYLNGNLKAAVGFQFARQGLSGSPNPGSDAQGDTFLWLNCLFGQFTQAAVRLGTPTIVAGNLVDWHFKGGDWQGNLKYGVESYGGTFYVDGTGQQNQGIAWAGGQQNIPYLSGAGAQLGGRAGATHVGNYAQIDNLGCDFFMTQYSSRGAILNLRSESFCLTRGGGIARIENCEAWAGPLEPWGAATAFVQGELIRNGTPVTALDGRAWGVWTATPTPGLLTTGGAEPAWATARKGFMQENVNVNAGSAVINCHCPIQCVDKGTLPGIGGNEWGAIVVDPSGVNGKFYAKVLSHATSTSITLDANVPWNGSAIVRMGELVTDGGLQFIPYDFKAISGEFEKIDGGEFECGQIEYTICPGQGASPRVSRQDWLYDPWYGGPFSGGSLSANQWQSSWTVKVGPGTSHIGSQEQPQSFVDPAFLVRFRKVKGPEYRQGPIMWPRSPFVGSPAGEVGLWGCDGAYALVGSATDLTRNSVSVVGNVLAPEPVGFPDHIGSEPANTQGPALTLVGGTATGTQPSAGVSVRTSPAGSSGSSVNDSREIALFDGVGRMINRFGSARGAVSGTINIAGAGSATPSPNGAEVYRYNLQGTTGTINNPTDALVDGQGFEIEFLNSAGANSTVTFGSLFLLGATSTVVANGKWMTFAFRYDATLGKFKLKNGNGL